MEESNAGCKVASSAASTRLTAERRQVFEGLLANGEEPTLLTPEGVTPVEVEDALRPIRGEVGNTVFRGVPEHRVERNDLEIPLDVGELRPKRQELLHLRGTQTVGLEIVLYLRVPSNRVQVDQLESGPDHVLAVDWECAFVDIVVLPVVATGGHHLVETHSVVDGHDVLARLVVDVPMRVHQERLEILPGDTAGQRLGDQLADLPGGDIHLLFSLHLPTDNSTQGSMPSILLPLPDRHGNNRRKSPAFFRPIFAKISQKKAENSSQQKERTNGILYQKIASLSRSAAILTFYFF